MNQVNIARFKAQLSHYLRSVRKGEEIIVTDHNVPVAMIVPIVENASGKLHIRKAVSDPTRLATKKFPPIAKQKTTSLAFLLEERGGDR